MDLVEFCLGDSVNRMRVDIARNRRVSASSLRVSPGPARGFMINGRLNVFTVVKRGTEG